MLSLNEEEYLLICQLLEQIKKEISNYQHKDKHYSALFCIRCLNIWTESILKKNTLSAQSYCNELHGPVHGTIIHRRQGAPFNQFLCQQTLHYAQYLNERVKNDTGIPVTKHIQRALLIEAKKQLLYTDHSINEIGMTLGFEDTSYFIRFFRKLTKKTPGEFRRKEKP